jgi:hypothetical protein
VDTLGDAYEAFPTSPRIAEGWRLFYHVVDRGRLLPGRKKKRKKPFRRRSLGMQIITKRLRLLFYLLATVELVLVSVAWGRLPLH